MSIHFNDFAPTIKDGLSKKISKNIKLPTDKLRNKTDYNDELFDSLLPEYYQFCSIVQWSPWEVAQTMAEWLQEENCHLFLDIGSGVGKICFYLRLLTNLEIHGVEQRNELVQISNEIFTANDFEKFKFFNTNIINHESIKYDAYYLFNPFYEQISDLKCFQIDNKISYSESTFKKYTSHIDKILNNAPKGTVLITYHGFGKPAPNNWVLIKSKMIKAGFLELRKKL